MNVLPGMRLFQIRGVPVYVHWSVLLLIPIVCVIEKSLLTAFLGTLACTVVIAVHELGHAAVARRFGLRVRSLRLALLAGQCVVETPRSKRAHVAIAWGGVAAQLVLGVVTWVVAMSCAAANVRIPSVLNPFFAVFELLNPFIAACNLLPIRPFDGAAAWGLHPLRAVQ